MVSALIARVIEMAKYVNHMPTLVFNAILPVCVVLFNTLNVKYGHSHDDFINRLSAFSE
jgi:hypothetical protein